MMHVKRTGRLLAIRSATAYSAGEQNQPNALRGASRAGGGDMGYPERPGRELGAFIDRLDRDKRA